ncbi:MULTISPECIES: AraC family transcriptional regulator [Aliivibrio]|uniref:AraC family transcriptional regulator n=1 Tax=Aliivibrio logei 5S-186 TaxID=626086 RepID=A0ABX3B070_ALILO|nr:MULTISPECIES: AraC family transcriptional regulator [Aliivibrio]MBB1314103.1 helix-turn-helix transcriptional regulator [Aliivibrio sp. SR45-2]OEF19542.1 AraC family transcriptional regulator [Aliivibrio logei 5S-186]
MINWIQTPKNPDVAKYIDCYWFLERTDDSNSNPFPKLNPEPAGHLIIAASTQGYNYDIESDLKKGQGSHWLFPYSKTLQMDHTKGFSIIGIKFQVGALYLLGIEPKQPVVNEIVDTNISDFLCVKEGEQVLLLQQAKSDSEQLSLQLDDLFQSLFTAVKEDKHYVLTRKAIPLLATTPIAKLGELLHCSQRTLERSFLRVTGFTLKQCQSMNRLEAMLTYLYQREEHEINWTTVAHEFGFSDQPHLIRYLKSTLGVTPKEYAKNRDLTIDIYGGIESL